MENHKLSREILAVHATDGADEKKSMYKEENGASTPHKHATTNRNVMAAACGGEAWLVWSAR